MAVQARVSSFSVVKVTFKTWSYIINSSYQTANMAATSPPGITNATANASQNTMTTPANSLFPLWWQSAVTDSARSAAFGDPDVWTSTDAGASWYLVGGAHGLDGDTTGNSVANVGTYGQYVAALSGNTPFWQGNSPASYPAVSSPQSYSVYPGAVNLHDDSYYHKFYTVGGSYYAGSGHWNPTSTVQGSGATSTANLQLSTVSGQPINPEAIGWTNLCQTSPTSASYTGCGTFPARTYASGSVDSKGNLYIMNGVSSYDWTNVFPQVLLADVWMSSTGGATWTQPTTAVPWAVVGGLSGRMESASVTYFSTYYGSDVIYNIGGCSATSAGYGVTGSNARRDRNQRRLRVDQPRSNVVQHQRQCRIPRSLWHVGCRHVHWCASYRRRTEAAVLPWHHLSHLL